MKRALRYIKNSLKNVDIPLLLVTTAMIIFGLIMVFSSSSVTSVLSYKKTPYYFFEKQILVVIVGLFVSLIVVNFPTKNYGVLSKLGMILMIVLLISLKTYGTVTNSARSWFKILGFSIQPSEFAKTFIILYLACTYSKIKKFKSVSDVFLPMIPCIIIFFLVALEPDLGTASIIAIICMFIFFSLPLSNNKNIKILRIATVIAAIGGVFFLNFNSDILTSAQASRFNFKNPCSRYLEKTGYQVCNGYIAIHNGGIFGVGLGASTQKFLYLPAAHTDFIFPIIVEELGLIGGTCVLIAYIIILFRILVIARNATNLRNSIIAFGTFAYILSHIVINLGGLLALIPLTGVPLPLLSYGGSFMLNIMILIALTQRVNIETKRKRETEY